MGRPPHRRRFRGRGANGSGRSSTAAVCLVRNPLYLGNILLWLGFAVSARLLWLAPIVVVLLALEYHAIVRWEERLLESRMGESYRQYMQRVPRWISNFAGRSTSGHDAAFSWTQTFYSERGTLIAIAAATCSCSSKPSEVASGL